METRKLMRDIYETAKQMRDEIYDMVSKADGKIIINDPYENPCTIITIDSTFQAQEEDFRAIRINHDNLLEIFSTPVMDSCKIFYTKEDIINDDEGNWKWFDIYSEDIYALQTIVDVYNILTM